MSVPKPTIPTIPMMSNYILNAKDQLEDLVYLLDQAIEDSETKGPTSLAGLHKRGLLGGKADEFNNLKSDIQGVLETLEDIHFNLSCGFYQYEVQLELEELEELEENEGCGCE